MVDTVFCIVITSITIRRSEAFPSYALMILAAFGATVTAMIDVGIDVEASPLTQTHAFGACTRSCRASPMGGNIAFARVRRGVVDFFLFVANGLGDALTVAFGEIRIAFTSPCCVDPVLFFVAFALVRFVVIDLFIREY